MRAHHSALVVITFLAAIEESVAANAGLPGLIAHFPGAYVLLFSALVGGLLLIARGAGGSFGARADTVAIKNWTNCDVARSRHARGSAPRRGFVCERERPRVRAAARRPRDRRLTRA